MLIAITEEELAELQGAIYANEKLSKLSKDLDTVLDATLCISGESEESEGRDEIYVSNRAFLEIREAFEYINCGIKDYSVRADIWLNKK